MCVKGIDRNIHCSGRGLRTSTRGLTRTPKKKPNTTMGNHERTLLTYFASHGCPTQEPRAARLTSKLRSGGASSSTSLGSALNPTSRADPPDPCAEQPLPAVPYQSVDGGRQVRRPWAQGGCPLFRTPIFFLGGILNNKHGPYVEKPAKPNAADAQSLFLLLAAMTTPLNRLGWKMDRLGLVSGVFPGVRG